MTATSHTDASRSIDRGLERVRAEIAGLVAHRVGRCAACGETVLATETPVVAGSDVLHASCAAEQDAARG